MNDSALLHILEEQVIFNLCGPEILGLLVSG